MACFCWRTILSPNKIILVLSGLLYVCFPSLLLLVYYFPLLLYQNPGALVNRSHPFRFLHSRFVSCRALPFFPPVLWTFYWHPHGLLLWGLASTALPGSLSSFILFTRTKPLNCGLKICYPELFPYSFIPHSIPPGLSCRSLQILQSYCSDAAGLYI